MTSFAIKKTKKRKGGKKATKLILNEYKEQVNKKTVSTRLEQESNEMPIEDRKKQGRDTIYSQVSDM